MPDKARNGITGRAGRGKGGTPSRPAAGRRGRAPARADAAVQLKELLAQVKTLGSHCRELDHALAKSRRANDEMRRTLANYRLLYADTLNPIFIITDKGQFLTANAAALRFMECPMKELKKKRPWEFGPPDKREQQKKEYSVSMSRRTAEMDFLVKGKLKTLMLNFLPLTLGKMSLLYVIGQDLTERKRMEQALRDSEATARGLLNAPTDVVFLIDREGTVFACNDTAARRFGLKPVEFVGKALPQLINPPSLRESRIRNIQEVFAKGQPVRFQDEREGRCFDTVSYPIRNEAGEVTKAAIVARDITEHELARRKLAEQEAALAEAQALAHFGSWERDLVTGRERWSDEQYRLVGMEPGEAEPDFDLIERLVHPDDRAKLVRFPGTTITEKEPVEFEFRVVRPSGELRWFLAKVKLYTDEQGRPVKLAGTNLDITERKLAEVAAAESQAVARALFDSQTEAVFLVTTDGTYIDCNETAARALGVAASEVRGRSRWELMSAEAADEQALRIQTVVQTRMPHRFAIDSAGTNYDVIIYPIADASGDVTKVAVVARDVTELRKAQQEKSDLREQLLHAQKLESLGILAGGIAHDFNNLLTSILGQADLALLTLPPDAPGRASLEEIVKTARRAAELTNQLLAYSGKGQFFTKVVDLGDVVRDMANLLEVTVSSRVALKIDIDDSIPGIEADVSQLRQVVMNLVMNASEALTGGNGMVFVRVGARKFDRAFLSLSVLGRDIAPGEYVYLEVKDSGCGMKPELLEKVFDPFFSTKFSGRGLGLATVLGIVKSHSGAIRVDSAPGKGTTFTILFPPSSRPAQKEEEKRESVPEMAGSGTILLVDDEEMVREPAARLLARLGFRVLTAANGKQALEVFRAHASEIVCVVLDLTMPEMSGEETFKELRRMRSDVKVILSSGYGETESIRSFPGRGPDGFLQKPYQLKQLAEKLKEVLGEGSGADSD